MVQTGFCLKFAFAAASPPAPPPPAPPPAMTGKSKAHKAGRIPAKKATAKPRAVQKVPANGAAGKTPSEYRKSMQAIAARQTKPKKKPDKGQTTLTQDPEVRRAGRWSEQQQQPQQSEDEDGTQQDPPDLPHLVTPSESEEEEEEDEEEAPARGRESVQYAKKRKGVLSNICAGQLAVLAAGASAWAECTACGCARLGTLNCAELCCHFFCVLLGMRAQLPHPVSAQRRILRPRS